MTLSARRVLVTGAGGFIGSHLVQTLVTEGHAVRAFVRYNSRHDRGRLDNLSPEVLSHVEIYFGDLRDPEAVRNAATGVEIIFHLGALISIPYSYHHPREVFDTNIFGTLNVLTAARDLGNCMVVHTSTSEVYGTALYVPIDERHPLRGQSPYAASKIAADKIAESFSRSYGFPVTTIRPFNTYGPRQSDRAIIPTVISQALMQKEIRLGALTSTRDFTFVEDIIEAFVKIASCDAALGQEINVGSNFEIYISALVHMILRMLNCDNLPVRQEKIRLRPETSEVERLWADNTKAKELLGWTPKVSLEKGLRITIDWIKNHLYNYRPEIYRF